MALSPQVLPLCQKKPPCVPQWRGPLLLPPGDHLHVGMGDACWSFAHTVTAVSPACGGLGWFLSFFLAFLLFSVCIFFFHCPFAKKAPFSWVYQKVGAAGFIAVSVGAQSWISENGLGTGFISLGFNMCWWVKKARVRPAEMCEIHAFVRLGDLWCLK